MVPVIWSPRSLDDLDGLLSYIERDSPYYARQFGERIFKLVEFIRRNPQMGSIVAEYNLPELRERLLQNYRIVYRALPDRVEIVTICHAARLLHIDE